MLTSGTIENKATSDKLPPILLSPRAICSLYLKGNSQAVLAVLENLRKLRREQTGKMKMIIHFYGLSATTPAQGKQKERSRLFTPLSLTVTFFHSQATWLSNEQ